MSSQEFIKDQSFRTFFIGFINSSIFLIIGTTYFPPGYRCRSRTQIIFIWISIREVLNYPIRLFFTIIIESYRNMILPIISCC